MFRPFFPGTWKRSLYLNSVAIANGTRSFFTAKPDDQSHSDKHAYPCNNSPYTNAITSIALNFAAETSSRKSMDCRWSCDDPGLFRHCLAPRWCQEQQDQSITSRYLSCNEIGDDGTRAFKDLRSAATVDDRLVFRATRSYGAEAHQQP